MPQQAIEAHQNQMETKIRKPQQRRNYSQQLET